MDSAWRLWSERNRFGLYKHNGPTLPRYMNAVVYNIHGEADVLEDCRMETPVITRPKKILIRTEHASINPADIKLRYGIMANFNRTIFPQIPGQDLSGVVVDSSSEKFKPGDRVMGCNLNGGAAAEYAIFREEHLARVPDQMSSAEAACLPTVGLTAYQTLVEYGKIDKTKRVLVLGGAGGVGSYTVQYCKKVLNAEVHATCSTYNKDFVLGLGASQVYDHSDPNYHEKIFDSYDLIIDTAGKDGTYKKLLKTLVKKNGSFVKVGIHKELYSTYDALMDIVTSLYHSTVSTVLLKPKYKWFVLSLDDPRQLEIVAHQHLKHKLSTYISRYYPLNATNLQLAHKIIELGHTRGKLLMQVQPLLSEKESYLTNTFLKLNQNK
ncbi:quinone-oxidoreductase [Acrasis kona]|uniref:Quinone-oxidoreductase n=1 Tax=Acrasis kona TaxID=1008807 RepID=A0AAW2ZC52_9EUKA